MKATLDFDLPADNETFESAMYSSQLKQALINIRAKLKHKLEKEGILNQKRQIYDELNDIILDELTANGVAHIF